jgi:hypothetical protein
MDELLAALNLSYHDLAELVSLAHEISQAEGIDIYEATAAALVQYAELAELAREWEPITTLSA